MASERQGVPVHSGGGGGRMTGRRHVGRRSRASRQFHLSPHVHTALSKRPIHGSGGRLQAARNSSPSPSASPGQRGCSNPSVTYLEVVQDECDLERLLVHRIGPSSEVSRAQNKYLAGPGSLAPVLNHAGRTHLQ